MTFRPGKLEAEANRLTDIVCEDQRDEVEAAHTAFKILHANYMREREEVFQHYLTTLTELEEQDQ
jgi:predicted metal-dependent phosphoesterase TrpH